MPGGVLRSGPMPTVLSNPSSEEVFDPEFARVLRMADPGPALDGPLTFLPLVGSTAAAWQEAWVCWRDQTLTATIAPVLATVARHAERGEAREIQEIDKALTGTLDPASGGRSTTAGAHFLRRLSVARGDRWLTKFQLAAAAGQTPAHFPVVYAAQSVLFHLPLRLLLPGYAYWEWTVAMMAYPPTGGRRPKFAAEAASLRALAEATLSTHVFDAAEPFRAAANVS